MVRGASSAGAVGELKNPEVLLFSLEIAVAPYQRRTTPDLEIGAQRRTAKSAVCATSRACRNT
jgi:hypothetical protein